MRSDQAPEAWRRELLNYARRVVTRAPHEPILIAARALRAGRARRGAPEGFVRGPAQSGSTLRALQWPLRLPDGGVPATMQLATRDWPLSNGAPWAHPLADPEDALAAHRFSWVIPALAASGRAAVPQAGALLRAWLEGPGAAGEGPGWDSYSVAERLTAMVYLQSAGAQCGDPQPFRDAIVRHARHLAAHLELRGASTNNHLINDARALYLAGTLLADATITAQARELLEFAVPAMFIDGFLREGSTHYHLLLHRTLEEITIAGAFAADHPFAERLSEWAAGAARASRFLHAGRDDMPMIGDLSPDYPPGFLAQWMSMFDVPLQDEPEATPPAVDAAGSHAGWFRAAAAGFVMHAFVNLDGYVPAWSHAHADLGSFTLSWHGRPLLVDGGRSTYAAGAMSTFGRSVRSHNAVAIDGFEPCVTHGLNAYPELLRADYRDARPAGRISADGEGARFDVSHEGFGRLGSGIVTSRSVILGPDRAAIEDRIQGAGQHRIETFFHFAPEADVTPVGPGRWRVAIAGTPPLTFESGTPAELVRGQNGPQPMGWTSRRYGSAVPSPSLVFHRDVTLPFAARYIFSRG